MSTQALENTHHHHPDPASKVIFGFWIYILTDFILFATLFATYAVLSHNAFGGMGHVQAEALPHALRQSIIFLASSFTYGLAIIALKDGAKKQLYLWLVVTFLLGLGFVASEYREFAALIQAGHTWQSNGFFSAFFSLVGIHGIHVTVGLLWMLVLMVQLAVKGITPTMKTRFSCLGLFWDFLNIVWIFIFTIVYLMGAI
jgi:cytochrome o ubiquinol oxidase subunit 3